MQAPEPQRDSTRVVSAPILCSHVWIEHTYNGRPDGRIVAMHADDQSGYHAMYPTGYDSRCNLCWLGIGHTNAAHEHSIDFVQTATNPTPRYWAVQS